MDTRSLMWIILGVILLVGGIASSLKEGKRGPSRPPRAIVQPQSPIPSAPPQEKKFDTGFSIDPIKGLKRKDENVEYFK